jgi:hypothetical protein
MSHPLRDESFTVVPDGVEALADELATLAAELTEDVERARSAAACFPEAFGGQEGWTAGATATSWACLYEVMAARTSALAGTLTAAVAAYVAEDAWLAGSVGSGRRPR